MSKRSTKSPRAAIVAVFVAAVAVTAASRAPFDLVAKAGNQELSVERLARLMANSSVPLQQDVAATMADFWVAYQLLGYAGAHGDTATVSTTNWWATATSEIDSAMWYPILEARSKEFFDVVTKRLAKPDTTDLEEKYLTSQYLAAQHILIEIPEEGTGMSEAQLDSVRRKAEDIRRRVTPQNFAALAEEFSADDGSKENGGTYAMFGPGTGLEMVPEFDQAVRKAKPGEIVPGLVRTTYGYHIIRRHTLAEVRQAFIDQLTRDAMGNLGETYVGQLREQYKLTLAPDAVKTARAVAINPHDAVGNRTAVATTIDGDFTAERLADWIKVIPPDAHVRETLAQAPDSLAREAITRIVLQDILDAQAIKEGVQVDSTELAQIRGNFTAMTLYAMTGLRIDPRSLGDSAKTVAERERLAASRVEAALDRLFQSNGKNFIEVPPELGIALRAHYAARVNVASLAPAVERARAVRAALDSTGARGSEVKKD